MLPDPDESEKKRSLVYSSTPNHTIVSLELLLRGCRPSRACWVEGTLADFGMRRITRWLFRRHSWYSRQWYLKDTWGQKGNELPSVTATLQGVSWSSKYLPMGKNGWKLLKRVTHHVPRCHSRGEKQSVPILPLIPLFHSLKNQISCLCLSQELLAHMEWEFGISCLASGCLTDSVIAGRWTTLLLNASSWDCTEAMSWQRDSI